MIKKIIFLASTFLSAPIFALADMPGGMMGQGQQNQNMMSGFWCPMFGGTGGLTGFWGWAWSFLGLIIAVLLVILLIVLIIRLTKR